MVLNLLLLEFVIFTFKIIPLGLTPLNSGLMYLDSISVLGQVVIY